MAILSSNIDVTRATCSPPSCRGWSCPHQGYVGLNVAARWSNRRRPQWQWAATCGRRGAAGRPMSYLFDLPEPTALGHLTMQVFRRRLPSSWK
jgi:hypothetical protein